MTISALGELIRTKKRDEISKIVSFLSGNFQNHQVLIREPRAGSNPRFNGSDFILIF